MIWGDYYGYECAHKILSNSINSEVVTEVPSLYIGITHTVRFSVISHQLSDDLRKFISEITNATIQVFLYYCIKSVILTAILHPFNQGSNPVLINPVPSMGL